jgi:hypothetical protein
LTLEVPRREKSDSSVDNPVLTQRTWSGVMNEIRDQSLQIWPLAFQLCGECWILHQILVHVQRPNI